LVSPRILRKAGSSRHFSLTVLMGALSGSPLRQSLGLVRAFARARGRPDAWA